MTLKKYCVQEEVTIIHNTKLYIKRKLSNKFRRCYQRDAGDKRHKYSELKEIKVLLFQLIFLTLSISKIQPEKF